MKLLRSRLLSEKQVKQKDEMDKLRRIQIGSGDRSEKIRTYNFPQNRFTDHRIGLTLYQLDMIMDGRLDSVVDALTTYYQAEKLREQAGGTGPNGRPDSDPSGLPSV